MSSDVEGGLDYARLKRHYLCDDYPSLVVSGIELLNGIPFTAAETYYISGLMAYLNDNNVIDLDRGWTTFTHNQPVAPAYLAAILAALGVSWPATVPAFEAKDILFYATENCWVRFEGSSRVQHYIPKEDYIRFHRRCFIFWVQQDSVSGTLRAWLEG
jgi:hypothetical protein